MQIEHWNHLLKWLGKQWTEVNEMTFLKKNLFQPQYLFNNCAWINKKIEFFLNQIYHN